LVVERLNEEKKSQTHFLKPDFRKDPTPF